VAAANQAAEKLTLADFSTNYPWKRPSQGLYEIEVGLKNDKDLTGKRIAALGDLNDDKWIDLVTISQTGDSISVHFYQPDKGTYNSDFSSFKLQSPSTSFLTAENVVVSKEKAKYQGLMVTVRDD
jgi:hypothetical protein